LGVFYGGLFVFERWHSSLFFSVVRLFYGLFQLKK